jgi:hypothetical protein
MATIAKCHAILLRCAGRMFSNVQRWTGRYYASRYGYFNLVPGEPAASEKIDPADRRMKVCSATQHAHSYMAITRPKNSSPGTRALWCWHCCTCTKTREHNAFLNLCAGGKGHLTILPSNIWQNSRHAVVSVPSFRVATCQVLFHRPSNCALGS